MTLLKTAKAICLPRGRHPRQILTGLFRGLEMHLDLQFQSKTWVGLYEREIYSWTRRLTRGIRTAIDIGSAEGEFTLYFLKRTAATKVYAFEPSSENIGTFNLNLAINGVDHDPRLLFERKFLMEKPSANSCRLDTLQTNVELPCFIKIDVDGPELDVLKSGRELIKEGDVRLLVETHSMDAEQGCSEFLKTLGFQTRVIKNAWWRIIIRDRRPVPHNRWLVAYKVSG